MRESPLIGFGRQMLAAFNAADPAAVASFYADDAVLMAPDGTRVEGRTAIEAHLRSILSASGLRMSVTPNESSVVGPQGFVTGTYAIWLQDVQVGSGDFVEIWKHVGGEWRIAFDILNRRPAS